MSDAFLGLMARNIRYLPYPHCAVEVTVKTFQGRKLLRPSREVNDLILGVIGRALHVIEGDVGLFSFQILSTHIHLHFAPESQKVLSEFMAYVLCNISKEVGRLVGWSGPFWDSPFKQMLILDEQAMEKRLWYVLANGVKEGLVARVEDWPGVSCYKSLLTGEPQHGTWYDRTALYNVRRTQKGRNANPRDFATVYPVHLSPPPFWKERSSKERSHRVAGIISEINAQAAQRIRTGRKVLGVKAILNADPLERPENSTKNPAPYCVASSPAVRAGHLKQYRLVVSAHASASKAFRSGQLHVLFPEGTFRPNGSFVPWTQPVAPP